MKLYVWEGPGVLEDYSTGMIVALAESLPAALRAVDRTAGMVIDDARSHDPQVTDLGPVRKRPRAWLVWGGG